MKIIEYICIYCATRFHFNDAVDRENYQCPVCKCVKALTEVE